MGTNYYAVYEHDPHLSMKRRPNVHIGKNSSGSRFLFSTADGGLESWAEWRHFLSDPKVSIIDEYDKAVSLEEFVRLVETAQIESEPSVEATVKTSFGRYIIDSEGYELCDVEFC